MDKQKRRRGDRKDGTRVPENDPMHLITPYLLPNRADNEAVLTEVFDMTAIEAYLAEKNADNPEFKYTFFHVICAAIAKVLVLRPRMNRFYAGKRLYDRNDIIFSFVVKKKFEDNGAEALAIITIGQRWKRLARGADSLQGPENCLQRPPGKTKPTAPQTRWAFSSSCPGAF